MTSSPMFTGLATLLFLASSQLAIAGDRCCDDCGCTSGCAVVCILKCETKEVEVTCWACKHEDICVPGPSRAKCRHCETVCADGSCNCGRPQVQPKKFVWFDWCVGGAEVRTRKRLMKQTIKKKVPSYRWEVKRLCGHCENGCQVAQIVPGTEDAIPAPPVAHARLIYVGRAIAPAPVQTAKPGPDEASPISFGRTWSRGMRRLAQPFVGLFNIPDQDSTVVHSGNKFSPARSKHGGNNAVSRSGTCDPLDLFSGRQVPEMNRPIPVSQRKHCAKRTRRQNTAIG